MTRISMSESEKAEVMKLLCADGVVPQEETGDGGVSGEWFPYTIAILRQILPPPDVLAPNDIAVTITKCLSMLTEACVKHRSVTALAIVITMVRLIAANGSAMETALKVKEVIQVHPMFKELDLAFGVEELLDSLQRKEREG